MIDHLCSVARLAATPLITKGEQKKEREKRKKLSESFLAGKHMSSNEREECVRHLQ